MRHHGNGRYFQCVRCGLEQQTTFLPVLWRSTEHFFLMYSALQDDCRPDTLRLLGKTTGTCSPCKLEPRPSMLQINVIISRLQSKVFPFLFSALKALIFLTAELQRLHGCFSHSGHGTDMVRTCSSETFILHMVQDLRLPLSESVSRYFPLGEGTSLNIANWSCLNSREEVEILISHNFLAFCAVHGIFLDCPLELCLILSINYVGCQDVWPCSSELHCTS